MPRHHNHKLPLIAILQQHHARQFLVQVTGLRRHWYCTMLSYACVPSQSEVYPLPDTNRKWETQKGKRFIVGERQLLPLSHLRPLQVGHFLLWTSAFSRIQQKRHTTFRTHFNVWQPLFAATTFLLKVLHTLPINYFQSTCQWSRLRELDIKKQKNKEKPKKKKGPEQHI